MFNPFTSKFRNGTPSVGRIYDSCPAEKLHLKFCKYILGVHSKATNTAVLSELGRFPMHFNIIKAMLKYFYRLESSRESFPLLHDAFIESRTLSEANKPSWYASVKVLLNKIKSSMPLNVQNTKVTSKFLENYFLEEWAQNLNQHSDGKLCSYILFKSNFGCEKYLSVIQNFELRKYLTRLRLSAHSLRIEKGRYQGIPRHSRTCLRCSSGAVEDEIHFLLNCCSLDNNRSKLLTCISKNCVNFQKLNETEQFIWLMTNENKDILFELCTYIKCNEKYID